MKSGSSSIFSCRGEDSRTAGQAVKQYRLHRIMATEHNLFAIGLTENSDLWDVNHPEAQTAFVLAETLRRSKDPLLTLSIYEQRLMRQ
jgi:hypothetical protein